jgi:hypothetical protein
MKYLYVFFLNTMLFFLTNCASLQSVSITNIPKDTKKPISTSQTNLVFLFMNFNNDYADLISEDLRKQCQGGVVSGILTKNELICHLPFCFFYSQKITAKGFCTL